MNTTRSSAPGKVVLSGEYAVLDGAPAVAMAVNRRAHVTVTSADALTLQSMGLRGQTDTRLFDLVCDVLGIEERERSVVMDTRAFADAVSGRKFGIGSSAALVAALARALAPPESSDVEVLRIAQTAHRRFQDGKGSGVDVATSISGGLVAYRIGAGPERLNWPGGLCYALLWSGVPASTASRLQRLSATASRASAAALADAACAIAAAWERGDAESVVCEYRHYARALAEFDVDHQLGIFDAGHDELASATAPASIVYKPCGAGGGDIGIVLGTDSDAVQAFAEQASTSGFTQLDMTIDEQGAILCGDRR